MRGRLLCKLKEAGGNWVSGEVLSREFSVTRSAVWKQIAALRGKGYPIEASTKNGYRLRGSPDLLYPEEIIDGLKTRTFGRNGIHCFSELDSTNAHAGQLARDGAPEGAVVVAECQLEGKGRRGRDWFSPPGTGVYISLVLRPRLLPSEASVIPLTTSVAAAQSIAKITALPVRIKWPNDLLVRGRKVAGVLTEISTEPDVIKYMIAGIGINVNVKEAGFPLEVRSSASSLLIEAGREFPRLELIRALLESFEENYRVLMREGFSPVRERWRQLTDIFGRQVAVNQANRTIRGKIIDLDPDGSLLLRDRQGIDHHIFSGDIEYAGGDRC